MVPRLCGQTAGISLSHCAVRESVVAASCVRTGPPSKLKLQEQSLLFAPSVKVGDGSLVSDGPVMEVLGDVSSTTLHDTLAGSLKTGGNPGQTALMATVCAPTLWYISTGFALSCHGSPFSLTCHRSHLGSETLTLSMWVPAGTNGDGGFTTLTDRPV